VQIKRENKTAANDARFFSIVRLLYRAHEDPLFRPEDLLGFSIWRDDSRSTLVSQSKVRPMMRKLLAFMLMAVDSTQNQNGLHLFNERSEP
jgi:hypothetical protein